MKWFKKEEFACRCCQENLIENIVIEKIDRIRDEIGVPLKINSGFRCLTHNRNVGGKPGSLHTLGKAIDVSTSELSGEKKKMLLMLGCEEFSGIGVARTFFHFDIGLTKVWLY